MQSYATHGITVSGFTSTPYNVSVGGTDFGDTYAGTNSTYWSSTNGTTDGSALSYIPEIPWNDSCASELIADYVGYSQTYGSSGLLQQLDRRRFPEYHRGQRRAERLRHRNGIDVRRCQRELQGISQAFMAIRSVRQPERQRAGHSGRLAVRRQRRLVLITTWSAFQTRAMAGFPARVRPARGRDSAGRRFPRR